MRSVREAGKERAGSKSNIEKLHNNIWANIFAIKLNRWAKRREPTTKEAGSRIKVYEVQEAETFGPP